MFSSTTDYEEYLQNLEIFIGDDVQWENNPKCQGGPFLRVEDQSNYYYSARWGYDWAFGLEAWCNMEGRYTTIVADYEPYINSYSTITPSICNFAVLGTRYIRDTPTPEVVQLELNEVKSIFVESIFSELEIGNTLYIKKR